MAKDEINTDFNPLSITREIKKIFKSNNDLDYRYHAEEQMYNRGITAKDVECVLLNGSCDLERKRKKSDKLWRYKIIGRTPNSENREIGVVIVIKEKKNGLKVITAMWID